MTTNRPCALGVLALLTVACGLPSGFDQLTLEGKVASYQRMLRWPSHGPSRLATDQISWHGVPAADLMARYVSGELVGLPVREAAWIIYEVQVRGCHLQGTHAHEALKNLLKKGDDDLTALSSAQNAISAIEKDLRGSDDNFVRKGGPCSGAQAPQ